MNKLLKDKKFFKWRFVLLALIVGSVIVVGWYLFGLSGKHGKIRNILLISIDTCRADYLSCYGYPYETTPNIDALSREGILFENVISPVPMTLPAHCSMLTGTIPPYHGVHNNHDYHLADSHVTLAELLHQNGFTTGAIVSAFVLDSQFGLDQGFDTYDDSFQEEHLVHNEISERKGDETTRCSVQWLEKHQRENFFLFLHYFDPHEDYEPPEPFKSTFSRNSNHLREQLNDAYAGEIAYTDYCIGQVLNKLKELGLYDSTLIVVVGDHGELLGEHGEPTHSYYIYQNAIKVPLIFKLPGRYRSSQISQMVGIIDIVPTICSLLGIELPHDIQGTNLSELILKKRKKPEEQRYLYCESFRPTIYGANPLLSVVTHDNWKYIQTTRPELYDLSKDPHELNNLILREGQQARILQDHLKQILEQTVCSEGLDSRIELDENSRKRLESLGYVAGGISEDFKFDQSKKDPKDLFDFHLKHQEVTICISEGRYDRANVVAENMVAEQPDFYPAYKNLAEIALKYNNISDATRYFQQMIRIKPEDAEAHTNLGALLQSQGKIEDGIRHYRLAIQIDPECIQAHNNLGNALLLEGKSEEAMAELKIALKINPRYADAHYNLGKALGRSGRSSQALEHFQKAVSLRPNWPAAINHIAWILATDSDSYIRNGEKAVLFAKQASLLTQEQDAAILDTLAAAFATAGNFAEAEKTAQKAIKLALKVNQQQLAEEIQKRLELYKSGHAYQASKTSKK